MADKHGEGPLVGDFDPNRVDHEKPVGPAARSDTTVTPDDVLTAGYDPEEEEFEDVELPDKEAADKEAAPEMAPPSKNPPMSDQMDSPDLGEPDRSPSEGETDLNPHGAPDNARDRIQDRIDQLKEVEQGEGQIQEDGHEIVEEEFERQQAEHEDFQSTPTDTGVDRSIEQSSDGDTRTDHESTTGYQTPSRYSAPKVASKPLAILEQPGASPIRIMVEMDDQWGDDWRDWEYETIFQTAHDDGIDVHRQNEDKIMALKVLLNTDRFWGEARVFEKVCLAFNDKLVDWMVSQKPEAHEMSATCALVDKYIDDMEFSEEVKTYIAGAAIHAGFIMLPPRLRFASDIFSKKLMENMGDDALERQETLMQALDENDPSMVDDKGQIQFFRQVRCYHHAQNKLDNV